jgi:uncharacterized protein (TIGR02001 family)
MQKKLLPALLAVLTTGAGSLCAQTAPAAPAAAAAPTPAYTLTLTPALVSNYMFRGQRLSGFSAQPSVEFDQGDLGIGVWTNFPIRDDVPDTSDPEIDLYGFYNVKINDALSLAPGFTAYYYPNATTNNGFYRSTFEPNIALNYTVEGFKITPKLYYDFVLRGPTAEVTGTYAIPLKDMGTELDFTGQFGTYKYRDVARNGSPSTKQWGDYWLLGVALPFQINKDSKLTVGWAYAEGRNAFFKTGSTPKVGNSLAVGKSVFTVSYAWTF